MRARTRKKRVKTQEPMLFYFSIHQGQASSLPKATVQNAQQIKIQMKTVRNTAPFNGDDA